MIGLQGVEQVLHLSLDEEEAASLRDSAAVLRDALEELEIAS